MRMYMSLIRLRLVYLLTSWLSALRMYADSFLMMARSSAAVFARRTFVISALHVGIGRDGCADRV